VLYFNTIEKHKSQGLAKINEALLTHPNLATKSKTHQKYTLRECMFADANIWVLKPNDFNRGRGVTLFNSVEQMRKLIAEFTAGVEVPPQQKAEAPKVQPPE
jgi:uncharacterized cupredoxin-like copper-binding protein